MLLQKLSKRNEEFFLHNSVGHIIFKILEELAQVELYEAVVVSKDQPETEIFNYFANVSQSFASNVLENERRGS